MSRMMVCVSGACQTTTLKHKYDPSKTDRENVFNALLQATILFARELDQKLVINSVTIHAGDADPVLMGELANNAKTGVFAS